MREVSGRRLPVLVTGGAGFIGSHLVRALAQEGRQVRVLDDLSTGQAQALAPLEGVRLVRGSVLDPHAVAAAAEGAGLIIHLAGVVGMRLAADKAAYAYEVGRRGTANVLRHSGTTPAVVVSSSAVYGLGEGSTPLTEDTELDRNLSLAYDGGTQGYATGKWEAEQLATSAAAHRPVLVVRPFNVVGHRQRSRYGMVLPTFLRQAAGNRPLTVHNDGTQRRCFTDITEFVRLLRALIDSPDAWRPDGGAYNIGSSTETSIIDLASMVLAATSSTAGVVHVPYQQIFPGRTDVTGRVPDLSRLREMTGTPAWPAVADIINTMLRTPRA
ncbi:NAD-dependent epimerase/dehydratase family protein [Streptomyces sp. NPDC056500]|uniref:NAD-dependent epimerase/dehydratase family protein n=1 Tax=Streptomyces sp. NPDC056500 TaxID=3345840 RepID=UPI0036C4C129